MLSAIHKSKSKPLSPLRYSRFYQLHILFSSILNSFQWKSLVPCDKALCTYSTIFCAQEHHNGKTGSIGQHSGIAHQNREANHSFILLEIRPLMFSTKKSYEPVARFVGSFGVQACTVEMEVCRMTFYVSIFWSSEVWGLWVQYRKSRPYAQLPRCKKTKRDNTHFF